MADRFGTTGDDQGAAAIIGTTEDDRYFGFAGFDWLVPTLGDDVLDGGADGDVAIYSWFDIFTNGITINNTDTEQNGVAAFTTDKRGFGTDTLVDMENFHGTNYDDEIYLGFSPDGTYTFDEWGNDLVVAYQGLTEEGNNFVAGPGNDTYVGSVADDDGIDYDAIYTGTETGVVVEFTGIGSGTALDPWGGTDTFSGIEEIDGTQQDDTITTGDGDNDLVGFAGNDTLTAGDGRDDLFGGAGDDILDGGAGDRDEARYDNDAEEGGLGGVTVDLAAGTATDGFGDTDTLIGIEDVRGTDSADTLRGDDGRNNLEGNAGDDLIEGRGDDDNLEGDAGQDTLNGGAGFDVVGHFDDPGAVTLDLAAGTATDGWGDTDTLISIEGADGSEHNDVLRGDNGENFLDGREGDDILEGRGDDDNLRGSQGNDTIDGGAGQDRVEYHRDADRGGPAGVVVDLAAGTATDGFGDTDTLISIEDVRGTDNADTIRGDDGNNDIEGRAGDDALYGRGGRDELFGGAGNDLIDGGDGDEDRVRYDRDAEHGGLSSVTVDLAAGTATDGFGDTDTLIGIEQVHGTEFGDTITGSADRNWIGGRDGDDVLTAVFNTGPVDPWDTGDDLSGGKGNDTLIGSEGSDYLQPGAGTDTVIGGGQSIGSSGDTLVYRHDDDATGGVTVTFTGLGEGTAVDWGGDTDTFTGIESVRGTDFADTVTADGADNHLEGEGGNDTLIGLGGDDVLDGGDGDDLLDGGDGGDYFRPGAGTDTIIGGDVPGENGRNDEIDYRDDDAQVGITVTFTSELDGTVLDWSGATDTFTGIEWIKGTRHADTFIGTDGRQEFWGNAGNDYFDGGAGDRDEIDYKDASVEDGATQGAMINLTTGTATDNWGDTDTIVGIEEVEGSDDFGDTIIGSAVRNSLRGNGGNDTIDTVGGTNNWADGGEGDDTIHLRGDNDGAATGAGDDAVHVYGTDVFIAMGLGENTIVNHGGGDIFLSYRELDQSVSVDLLAGTATKQGGEMDTFSGAVAVEGGLGDDTLLGGNGEFEQFDASVGDDTVDGRGGEDQLSYREIDRAIDLLSPEDQQNGVVFNLAAGTAALAGYGTTTFSNIERYEGGRRDDTFIGGTADDEFRGLGGTDTYNGGDGFDRVSFTGDWWNGGQGSITVDLAAGTATDGYGNAETLVSIESVFGGRVDDLLEGDGADNGIWGDDGDDIIRGRGGDDALSGGFGADTLTGGTGNDVFYGWIDHLDGDTIADLEAGDMIAVYADGWGSLLGADIWADASQIYIDTTGDGVAEAVMVNGSGYTGPIQSEGGPVGGPIPAVVSLEGAGGLIFSAPEGTGGGTTVTATLTRTGDVFSQVTVDYTVAGAGANPGSAADLTAGFGSGQVVFASGQTEAEITLTIAGDSLIEANELLGLTLTGISSTGAEPAVFSGETDALVRIVNDDFLQRVNITGSRAQEDTEELTFTVTREGPDLSQAIDVTVSLIGGNGPREASANDVEGGLPQTVTVSFAPGDETETITLAPIADLENEFHERVVAQIVSIDGAGAPSYEIGSGQAVGDIRNDDGIPPIPPGLDASSAMDPHLFTFDGLSYDFQAVGEFVLLEARSGDPLSIQIRYQPVPGSDYASHATAVATELGGVTLTLDLEGSDPLRIGGTATDLADAVGGRAVGDGMVYYDGEALTVVYGNGEQLRVDIFDTFLNANAFLLAGRDVHGLLGNANGDAYNDLALRDGTTLTQPVSFAELYAPYADSWRIDQAESLFDYGPGLGTADYTDTSFPRGEVRLDDLPQEVLDLAEEATAGITDPVLKQAAMLDFILTGDTNYIAGAEVIAPETVSRITPTDAPAPIAGVGVYAADLALAEGDSGVTEAFFTIYRTGDLSGEVTINYFLTGDIDEDDVTGPMSGSLTFDDGVSAQTVSVGIFGDTTVETDEALTFDFSITEGTVDVISSMATTTIVTDDFAPPEPVLNEIDGTSGSDNLVGTDGADAIRSLAGRYDKMSGGADADQFIFGAEANNGVRERNVILDYEVGIDEILLEDGASIASIRQTSSQVVIFLEGDRDAIYVRGDGVTADSITIVTDDVFELV